MLAQLMGDRGRGCVSTRAVVCTLRVRREERRPSVAEASDEADRSSLESLQMSY